MVEPSKRPGSNRKLRVFFESVGIVAAYWGIVLGFAASIFAGMMLKALLSH